ncbi:MAG: HAD family hydrolase [Desulfurococcales archaeon]|nr:HAD family hydrolase [Desulfurococcales archaeon]
MSRCCPRVVLLDLDGTVIDTMELYTEEASRLISEATSMELGEARRLYRETMGMPFRRQLLEAGTPPGIVEDVARRFEEWKRRLLSRIQVDPRVVEAVQMLRSRGIRVYLSTNNECTVIRGLLPQGVLDGVLCNDPGRGFEKGRPHLDEVLAREGVKPCEVAFIGDSVYDLNLYEGLGVKVLATRGLWIDWDPIYRVLAWKEECEAGEAD